MKDCKKTKMALSFCSALTASVGIMDAAASTTDSLFGMHEISPTYIVAATHEGKCGEGKCGGAKTSEGKGTSAKTSEGKCGEGKCGGAKTSEHKSGAAKTSEGKCGEGKCGGSK